MMDPRGKHYNPDDIDLDCINLKTVIRILKDRKSGDKEPFWCAPEQWLSLVHQLHDLSYSEKPSVAPYEIHVWGIEVSCREWRPDLFKQDGDRFIPCST